MYFWEGEREGERMKGSSKVIMGATLVMAVTLAIVLGLIMVLLVELYCSLLLRRRKELRTATSTDASGGNASRSTQQPQTTRSETPSLSSFGVLHAPRSLLFPAVSGKENTDIENQNPQPPHFSDSQIQKSISTSTSHQFKILYASPPPPALTSLASSESGHKAPIQCGGEPSSSSSSNIVCKENLVYISNPIYDNEVSQQTKAGTPFGTPDSSPSRLGRGSSSGDDDDDDDIYSLPLTPPLSPMKKLPAEACSVSLRNARSLATCGSDSNSNHGLFSTSSGSPSTSSW